MEDPETGSAGKAGVPLVGPRLRAEAQTLSVSGLKPASVGCPLVNAVFTLSGVFTRGPGAASVPMGCAFLTAVAAAPSPLPRGSARSLWASRSLWR